MPMRPPLSRQLQRAIEKELIAVRMPGGVTAVAAGGRRTHRAAVRSTRSAGAVRRAACPTAGCRSPRRSRRSMPAGRPHRRRLQERRAPSETQSDSPRLRGRASATRAAGSRATSSRRRLRRQSIRCTTPAEGGEPGHNAAAHHASAAADHRASGPSRDASADIARSLSLTISIDSDGAEKRKRIGITRADTSSAS